MSRKKTITLFFTEGSNITDEQLDVLERLPGGRHRNASLVDPDAPLERCDYVAGPAVPDQYNHLPVAEPSAPVNDEEDEEDPEHMTVAQLKAALDEAEVEYPATAKKAALVALYTEHLAAE